MKEVTGGGNEVIMSRKVEIRHEVGRGRGRKRERERERERDGDTP